MSESHNIAIPADVLEALQQSDKGRHPNAYQWQDWQDEVIKTWFPKTGVGRVTKKQLSDLLGTHGQSRPSEVTVRNRYQELTG